MKTLRRIAVAVPAACRTAALLACLGMAACAPPEPVRIGFIGGTSGRVADLGIAGRDAVLLAVDLRNQAGGVAGRKVEVLVRDDRQDPERAREVARDLIAQGVAGIVGPMTSAMAVATVPVTDAAGVVLVSPTASTDLLTGKDDSFFRVNASTLDNASRIARHHAARQATRRLAVAYDLGNKAYAESWLDGFRAAYLEGGGELVKVIPFSSGGDETFLALANSLLATRPDGVLTVANSMDTALLCQQIRKLDARIPILTSEWAATERLIELGGKAVEGVVVAQNFDRDSSAPAYRAFLEAYRARFHREPGFGGVIAFDAANVMTQALARRKPGQGLKEAILADPRFDGVQEPVTFDAFGDVRRSLFITVVRDGRFVVVE